MNLIIDPHSISSIFARKGYKFFENGIYNLNIFGIRANVSESDQFDDLVCCLYKNELKQWKLLKFKATTDPGKHWLLNPLNIGGTLILKPGQYKDAYILGVHGRTSSDGGYKALEQVGIMEYVRDNNKNNKLDFSLFDDPKNIIRGIFKSNIHRASQWKETLNVGMYSAGCQVVSNPKSFDTLISVCEQSEKYWGNKFTYTLIEEKDFN